MPKRKLSGEDDEVQAIKKQITSQTKSRHIRSLSAEKALQLIYDGAIKFAKNKQMDNTSCNNCVEYSSRKLCNYCNNIICEQCSNICYKCQGEFCRNCYFPTYDEENQAICYSCY